MRKIVFVFSILMILIINACGVSNKTQVAVSATPTISPTVTYTSTPSITPLPTIPTFTPTFDVSTIVTVTPAEKAECPKENLTLSFDSKTLVSKDGVWGLKIQAIIDLLNQGVQLNKIIESIHQELPHFNKNSWEQKDITADGVSELILSDIQGIYILSCKNGAFQKYVSQTVDLPFIRYVTFNVKNDMNLDGT